MKCWNYFSKEQENINILNAEIQHQIKTKNLMKQVACLSFNLSLRNFSRQALDPGLLYESLRPLKVIIIRIIMNILELTQVDQDEMSPLHF